MKHELSAVWLRRDLRLEDNTALSIACAESKKIILIFVFDVNILSRLPLKMDQRVTFIYDSIKDLDRELRAHGSSLVVSIGDPEVEVPALIKKLGANALYFNEDYEPEAKTRDAKVSELLKKSDVKSYKFKDQVIFGGDDILKSDGEPYKMFTPYKNSWIKKLSAKDYQERPCDKKKLLSLSELGFSPEIPSLEVIGFERSKIFLEEAQPGRKHAIKNLNKWESGLDKYHLVRNFPAIQQGTSGLSVYLRFGVISIRECVRLSINNKSLGSQTWLSELIWRDFFQMILEKFPHVVGGAFKKEYDQIKWLGKPSHFKSWCEGRTGYPIIDAGMRQLNQTGWMHNRLRMITASFLVKDLLVDWKMGEAYFAEKLLDFDLAANNGGWQWSASTGCDSQPYFRIFNPVLQSQKFDPDCEFIRKWIPEIEALSAKEIHLLSVQPPSIEAEDFKIGKSYPKPIVLHSSQKMAAIRMFELAIKKEKKK